MGSVVVGPDKHRHLPGGRTRSQGPTHPSPLFPQATEICRQCRADLVTVGREMIEQDLAFIGAAPAVKVLLLTGLSPDPTPDHAVAHAEFTGQLGPHGWMTERVGRVENVVSVAEPVGVYLSQQQVSDQ